MTPATSAPAVEEQAPSPAPHIKSVWFSKVTHPAGASRTAVVIHEYINWTDGAQTARAGFSGGWLCVHPGAGWPDACETCQHIELLTGGRS